MARYRVAVEVELPDSFLDDPEARESALDRAVSVDEKMLAALGGQLLEITETIVDDPRPGEDVVIFTDDAGRTLALPRGIVTRGLAAYLHETGRKRRYPRARDASPDEYEDAWHAEWDKLQAEVASFDVGGEW